MVFWDISFVSLVMSFIVMIIGFLAYKKNGSVPALLIGISYIFYIIPRIAYLMQITHFDRFLVFLRVIAYSIELAAVILLGKKQRKR